ncbi:Serine/threonine-protein kinase fray2 [Camellia lanceoleosa]|uniref:Serine/threonine-protein kinase fray2 n=1 Tax=Camellia lanceoleosa TaxID=1840588 RepID=A0ACC0FIJ0_9ERIC|nr:Serine/threonine-protein kinase fray2 [Camellia lanceoleosa]
MKGGRSKTETKRTDNKLSVKRGAPSEKNLMTASCLVKDPSKWPSTNKLLKHSFFKQARSNDYILQTLLEGLPALGDRLKALKVNTLLDLFFEEMNWHTDVKI